MELGVVHLSRDCRNARTPVTPAASPSRPMPLLRALLAPLAPRLCVACGGAAGASEPLCGGCRAALRWLPPVCVSVALPAAGDARGPAAVLPVWAPVAYEGPARDLLHAFKFGGRAALADAMAAHIAARAPAGLLGGVLVPVPIHQRRLRRRGFSQAAVLAAALARRTGLPVAPCLARGGDPSPQAGRGRHARLAAPGGAIAAQAAPHRALLVDDVVTTGATLAACAAALRAAGTAEAGAVAWARTPAR